MSLAWFTQPCAHKTGGLFTWRTDYSFVWRRGPLVRGVTVRTSEIPAADLTNTRHTFFGRSGTMRNGARAELARTPLSVRAMAVLVQRQPSGQHTPTVARQLGEHDSGQVSPQLASGMQLHSPE